MTAIDRDGLRALAAYEAQFTAPGFDFGHWEHPAPGEDGVVQLGYYVYSEIALSFIDEAYALKWVFDFDWMK